MTDTDAEYTRQVDEYARTRQMAPALVAWLAHFPVDPDAVAAAQAAHLQHGLDNTWPTLARYWLDRGYTWPQVADMLGMDTDDNVIDLTEQLGRQAASIKRQAAVIDTQAREIERLRNENEQLRQRAAGAARAAARR